MHYGTYTCLTNCTRDKDYIKGFGVLIAPAGQAVQVTKWQIFPCFSLLLDFLEYKNETSLCDVCCSKGFENLIAAPRMMLYSEILCLSLNPLTIYFICLMKGRVKCVIP